MPRVRQTVEYRVILVQLYFKKAEQERENQLEDTRARLETSPRKSVNTQCIRSGGHYLQHLL
jgi:hypothetical protein